MSSDCPYFHYASCETCPTNKLNTPPPDVEAIGHITLDNSPRGRLISLLGAMNLDAAKPWVDDAIDNALTTYRHSLIQKDIERMVKEVCGITRTLHDGETTWVPLEEVKEKLHLCKVV